MSSTFTSNDPSVSLPASLSCSVSPSAVPIKRRKGTGGQSQLHQKSFPSLHAAPLFLRPQGSMARKEGLKSRERREAARREGTCGDN